MLRGVELSERYRRVLTLLVREYIERGEPVSSLWLAQQSRLSVSSATVRNILAKLEAWGYVRQPHTSAGRVPTDLAYRCYVDQLLRARRPGRSVEAETRLAEAATLDEALANASQELSRVSHHLGFAVPPSTEETTLREIQFLHLGASRVLVVTVSTDGQISHKAVELPKPVGADELQQAANYLNQELAGLPLSTIRDTIVRQLAEERTLYDALRARALRLASSTFDELTPHSSIFIQGAPSLLDAWTADANQLSRATLRALFEMIEEKHRLVRLLNEYIEGPGLRIVIGTEHSAPDLRNFSLVASTYLDGGRTGTVGVLGPTRMRYTRAIAAVEGVAATLNRLFQ